MKKQLAQKFSQWLKSPFAHSLMEIEKQHLLKSLMVKPGEKILVLGSKLQASMFSHLTNNTIYFASNIFSDIEQHTDVIVEYQSLPFPSQFFDHIVLPHTLDFSTSYVKTLREANWALKPDGTLTVIGFNFWSLWGIRKLFSIRHKAPWCGYFRSYWRIKDAFDLLNYEIINMQRFCYRPPFQNLTLYKICWIIEVILQFLFPFAYGIYLVSAKKKIYGLTPLRPKWKMIPSVLPRPIANRVIRIYQRMSVWKVFTKLKQD